MSTWYQPILDKLLVDPLGRVEWQGDTYFLAPVTWADPNWTGGARDAKVLASCPTARYVQCCTVPDRLDYHYQAPLVKVPPVEIDHRPKPCLENWVKAWARQVRKKGQPDGHR